MALLNWHKFDSYNRDYLDYKDQARALLTKSLGFEPPLHLSVTGELTLRRLLSEIAEGADKQGALDYHISIHTDIIKTMMAKQS